MARKYTKRGTAHSVAAEGPDFAGATPTQLNPEMLAAVLSALKNPSAEMKAAAQEITVEQAQASMLKLRSMIPAAQRPVVADFVEEAGSVELADIIREGKHERNTWNAVRRVGGMSVNVNRVLIGTAAVLVAAKLWNVAADYYDLPTVGDLLS